MAITIEQMRQVQWDTSNNWDFYLEGLNVSFQGWCPATSLEIGFFGTTVESAGSSGAEFISGRTYPTLTISYVDSEDLKVTMFIKNWIQECVSEDGYSVLPIGDAAKDFAVSKLNSKHETEQIWYGKVVPNGTITYTGDTDASVPQYQINFAVVSGSMIEN